MKIPECYFYFVDDSYVECDFSHVLPYRSIVTKFHNIDHERVISGDHIGVFTYTKEESLLSILESNVCYQDVDQLCQPWVHKLYEIDRQNVGPNKTGSIFHVCQCVRYRTRLAPNSNFSRWVFL